MNISSVDLNLLVAFDALMSERNVTRAARRIGLKPDTRNFTPHVTIARLGRVETGAVYNFIRANSPFAAPAFTVERFTLFSARASTGGGPYVAEKRYPDIDWEEEG